MEKVIEMLIGNIRKFSWRGFLYRRTIRAKLGYIFDLALVTITSLLFCLVLTSAIAGVLTIIWLILMKDV
jgi:hypothetical protein